MELGAFLLNPGSARGTYRGPAALTLSTSCPQGARCRPTEGQPEGPAETCGKESGHKDSLAGHRAEGRLSGRTAC